MKQLFGSLSLMAFVIFAIVLRTWVITKLWLWYLVPGFGFCPITMVTAFGLSIFMHMMTHEGHNKEETKSEPVTVDNVAKVIGAILSTQLSPLLAGYIGTWFM